MVEKLQRRFALSRKGAVDTIKGSLLCALQNISFMLPVYMLYCLVSDMLGGALTASRIPFYATGTVICAAVILVCTYLQYNSTFLATYIETGVRRIGLAEKLRRIPLSFFGKKDLADLTSAIMNDCAVLETSQSHHICPLIGAIISTTLIALSLFIFNWRMALASVWVLPVAFCIVGLAAGVQKKLSAKSMAARLSCEDGIQECMESMPDLRANNAERRYLDGLNKKLRAPAEIVFVLPNNKNIIMAAEQSIPLCEDKTVVVVPTKTIPQGITAMLNFDPEGEVSDIVEAMNESLGNVHTAQVTYAARDSDFDGYAIHAGEYLALLDGKLIGSFTEMPSMLGKMSEAFGDLDPEIITVYYGEDVTQDDAETTAAALEEAFPDAEVTVVNGGQPVYYYMISVE